MKKNILKYLMCLFIGMMSLSSCNEAEFLEETPLDFYSPENSMVTAEQFQLSLNYLYALLRDNVWRMSAEAKPPMHYATDFAHTGMSSYANGQWTYSKLDGYAAQMVPTWTAVVDLTWTQWYKLIYNANVIINRVDESSELTDDERNSISAEAHFFRGYAYNILADLFGGVPLITWEIISPARDYVRAERSEIYAQAASDLEFAATYLDDVDQVVDGKLSKQAAQHLLVQAYISCGEYDKAIATADEVINHSATGLMYNRFGTYASEDGDVYGDLFYEGNANRSNFNNTESLFVLQWDLDSSGSSYSTNWNWYMLPGTYNIVVDGTALFVGPTQEKGGRGVGWFRPTYYFFNTLWEDCPDDIRNSSYNIVRDFQVDNPLSEYFGKWVFEDNVPISDSDTMRYIYPAVMKVAPKKFDSRYYATNSDGSYQMTELGEQVVLTTANFCAKDMYLYRLAETYLLRAEAYIHNGDASKAAEDINVIRGRAGTTLITAADVDIDFLLDERMRELHMEEMRMPLLTRLGKHYDRTQKYNHLSGSSIEEYHNLWPIPYSEIEANVYAELTQNPGYIN